MYETTKSISGELLVAILAVLKAGTKVADNFKYKLLTQVSENKATSSSSSFWTKGTQQIVTPTDIESDGIIKNVISEYFSDYCIISEEGGQVFKNGNPESSWIVDPLDGTTNFSQTIPYFVVSVALINNRTHLPELAAVFHPITGELFTCQREQGSYLHLISNVDVTKIDVGSLQSLLINKDIYRKIKCDDVLSPLKERIIDTGSALPHESYINRVQGLTSHKDVENLRDFSSAIYTSCKVAQGGSILVSNAVNVHLWDIVPSVLMIQEAGGAASDVEGKDIGLTHYFSRTLKRYLDTSDAPSEDERCKKFKEAVEHDRGKLVTACTAQLLLEYAIPAVQNYKSVHLEFKKK